MDKNWFSARLVLHIPDQYPIYVQFNINPDLLNDPTIVKVQLRAAFELLCENVVTKEFLEKLSKEYNG